jgi:acetyl esterase/lipase
LPVDFASLSPTVCTVSETRPAITAAGACTIEATQPGNESFGAAAPVDQSFAVDEAELTVTADDQSVVFGQPDPEFTFAYSGLVNGDTSAVIDLTPTCAVPDPHTAIGEYAIHCSGGEDPNYAFAYIGGTLRIEPPASQMIAFDPVPDRTYGDPPFTVSASASSGLPVGFASLSSDVCTSAGSTVSIVATGICTIEASQSGDETHDPAPQASRSFAVAKAVLTVTAQDAAKVYGAPLPTLTTTYLGFGLGQSLATSGLVGSPICSTTSISSSPAGTYPITCTASSLSSTNYSFLFVDGTLTVTAKVLTVTAANKSRIYGASNPPLTVSYSGFVLGQKLGTSGITGSPSCSTVATPSSPAGTYPIVCAPGTLISTNYRFTFVSGVLKVKPATTAWNRVPYVTVSNVTITSNIRAPVAGCPCPVMILVHGGGWHGGSSADWNTESVLLTQPEYGGFVVMAVDYRTACATGPLCGYHFPASDEDVQAAVDWAHTHMATYGGDPNRIVMLGSSAGGQIALDIATSGHGVEAVASWSAPMEFISACAGMCASQENYIGCPISTCPEIWHAASARNFVTPLTPPAYIVNSTKELVPLVWARSFVDALNLNGVANEFLSLVGKQHATAYENVIVSGGATVLHVTAQFLLDHSHPVAEG